LSPYKEAVHIQQGPAMTNYLNEENLKHLQRITQSVKLDFSAFVKCMINDEKNTEAI